MRKPLLTCLLCGIGMIILTACGDTRQITYLQGKFDTTRLSQIQTVEPVIQRGDLLSIIVYSDNPAATAIYNQPLITSAAASSAATSAGASEGATVGGGATLPGNTPSTPGYLVDDRGNIQFQGLGQIHVYGLTIQQLRDSLDVRLDSFLKNPYYTIRFLNYKFTMLGEVMHPGIFSIPGQHINLLEALGMAGDMTFYGRRDNILVIRENNGKREFGRLDITKPDVLTSPYFYLQQKDVVIVEATRKKVAASDQVTTRNISLALAAASTMAIIYSILKK